MFGQRRFEISLPMDRRRELDALAAETGVSASDLARLAIIRLLASRAGALRSVVPCLRRRRGVRGYVRFTPKSGHMQCSKKLFDHFVSSRN